MKNGKDLVFNRKFGIRVELGEQHHNTLCAQAKSAGRSKTREALLRLEDHLERFAPGYLETKPQSQPQPQPQPQEEEE